MLYHVWDVDIDFRFTCKTMSRKSTSKTMA
ncbi:hypothetical protein F383_24226 [Gossypium arboreum]|uniref:Uncharacterized protein n=1 Tax=Gossypium arboreum TaxID=29729 RepID=A0A0B0P764_GOSAR|nr:hypothetical protein F383_24226 [Gossypium arboreum]